MTISEELMRTPVLFYRLNSFYFMNTCWPTCSARRWENSCIGAINDNKPAWEYFSRGIFTFTDAGNIPDLRCVIFLPPVWPGNVFLKRKHKSDQKVSFSRQFPSCCRFWFYGCCLRMASVLNDFLHGDYWLPVRHTMRQYLSTIS